VEEQKQKVLEGVRQDLRGFKRRASRPPVGRESGLRVKDSEFCVLNDLRMSRDAPPLLVKRVAPFNVSPLSIVLSPRRNSFFMASVKENRIAHRQIAYRSGDIAVEIE